MIIDDNVKHIDDNKPEKWSIGIAICVSCFHVYRAQKHVDADPKELECPLCHTFKSVHISGELIYAVVEEDGALD